VSPGVASALTGCRLVGHWCTRGRVFRKLMLCVVAGLLLTFLCSRASLCGLLGVSCDCADNTYKVTLTGALFWLGEGWGKAAFPSLPRRFHAIWCVCSDVPLCGQSKRQSTDGSARCGRRERQSQRRRYRLRAAFKRDGRGGVERPAPVAEWRAAETELPCVVCGG
jgi:hypothetical protein